LASHPNAEEALGESPDDIRKKTSQIDCAAQQFVILGEFMAFLCLPAGVSNFYKRKGRHHKAAAQV
jgi:hypothetical protein